LAAPPVLALDPPAEASARDEPATTLSSLLHEVTSATFSAAAMYVL
jgi:hypothetical protein